MNIPRRQLVALAALALSGCAHSPQGHTPQAGMAPVNGTQLYFESLGTGDPVIFIHGLTLDTRMWDDQFGEFAKRHRAIRYDARGFGRSGPVTGPYSIHDDLRGLMDHLGVRRAHLVGLSMGGRYVIEFALLHPERVTSMVVVDAVLPGVPTPAFGREMGAVLEAGRNGDVAQAKRLWLGASLFAPANEQPATASRLRRMVEDYSGWHFVNGPGRHEQALAPPAAQRLGQIRVPTLVVAGSREIPELISLSERIARDVPGASLAMIPGAGHLSNMEAPAVFNRTVLDWIAARR